VPIQVALSTSSVWPESTAVAFEIAARLGYDGIEVMVNADPVSQDATALRRLADYHQMPVVAVHSPCLLLTQRIWGTEPWAKLTRAQLLAERLGARTVVTHPPFAWQRGYARQFVSGLRRMAEETDVVFAVENMYPQRGPLGLSIATYAPSWSPLDFDYPHVTLDISHAAAAGQDGLVLARSLGDRIAHVHLADGSGSWLDEHLVPGRGRQPCAAILGVVAGRNLPGAVTVEVNTSKARSHAERAEALAEALRFARAALHTTTPTA
jgi:sugar phosphate isomerase/epimerase